MTVAFNRRRFRPNFRAGPSIRASKAGLIASVVIAAAGAVLGAGAAYIGEFGAGAVASVSAPSMTPELANVVIERAARREETVRQVIEQFPLTRLDAPDLVIATPAPRPRIAVIVDDLGLDTESANAALSLPGPISFSILPYAEDIEWLALRAALGEGDVMLHLPMQPTDSEDDPGPDALRTDMSRRQLLRALEWNLSRFDGYVGVNNHMGSKLTADSAAMREVLAKLVVRGVYFLDSKTTNASVAQQVGAKLGMVVLARDVFLDPTPGDAQEVRRQLRLVEEIAMETGYAIAIAHPRSETLSELGPWLATIEARGFELTTPSEILRPSKPALIAASPSIRG